MVKLFIIGNGFDLAHGIKSSYSDFKEWLLARDETSIYDLLQYESSIDQDWNHFESALGTINVEDRLATYVDEARCADNDSYIAGSNMLSELESIYQNDLERLRELFRRWVNSIEIYSDEYKPLFGKLIMIKEKNFFLTFNYTETLEQVYRVNTNLLHIHGLRIEEGNLIFGHGEPNKDYEEEAISQCTEEEYMERQWYKYIPDYTAGYGSTDDNEKINSIFDAIHNHLKKDVVHILQQNQKFFNQLGNVQEVYSYGFSYSDVDMPYIAAIIDSIQNTSTTNWYFHDFNVDNFRRWEEKIQECGFKGSFHSFHV